MPRKPKKLLGRHIIADPEICHGKPTFVGTRIMVVQVLKQVAKGMPWDAIIAEWRGAVTREAIAEAVELAQRAFEDHAAEYQQESQPAGTSWMRMWIALSNCSWCRCRVGRVFEA